MRLSAIVGCAMNSRGSASIWRRNSSRSALARDRADQHPVAAAAVDGLDDELVEVLEHVAAVGLVHAEVGRHVAEDRLLAEVVADHLRHVAVDRLVVGDAGAGRVRERDVARAVGVEQARARRACESWRKISGSRNSSSTRR